MDKKEDRQFYWEITNFMQGKVKPPAKQNKSDIKDVAKSIIEQNKVFKQSSFVKDSNTINVVSQAIQNDAKGVKATQPSSQAFGKNVNHNPFSQLNEQSSGPIVVPPRVIPTPSTPPTPNVSPSIRPGTTVLPRLARTAQSFVSRNPWGALALGLLGLAGVASPFFTKSEYEEKKEYDIDAMRKKAEEMGGVPAPEAPKPAEAPKPKTLRDKLDDYTDAYGMPVPTFRERTSRSEGNYQEWRSAVDARNAALRAANRGLRGEREDIRAQLRDISKKKAELKGSIPPGFPGTEQHGPPAPGASNKAYEDLIAQQAELMRRGRSISDVTSNNALQNTLDQQVADRRERWATNLGHFKTKMKGVDFDYTNPEHQNVMRGVMGFGSMVRQPIDTTPQPGEMDPITGGSDWDGRYLTQGQRDRLAAQTPAKAPSEPARSNIGQVQFSDDTPDWVRRHAAKFGEDSARELEAMRLGVTSVLQGDPTRPMDTSLSAAEVARRGQLLDRDRKEWARQNQMTTSGRQTGVGPGRTAAQPESTWDEVARRSVQGDSELASAPLVRRGGRVYAQTANGEIELSTGSMNTSQYADNAPTRDQMNRGKR